MTERRRIDVPKESAEVIASCPNPECGEPIQADHPYTWCSECGEPFPEEIKVQLPQAQDAATEEEGDEGVGSEVDSMRVVGPESLAQRYRESYQSARTIIGAGNGVKTLGVLLAILLGIVSFQGDGFVLFMGLAFSLALGISLYVAGVMISAQGLLLRANVDSAVNTSTLLDNGQKSRILADG